METQYPSDQTKIGGVTLIRNGLFTTRQMSKRGSSLAARTSALKTPSPLTPYPHTYSGPSGHKDSPRTIQNVPYLLKKLRLSDRFFGIFLVISEVLYSENSDLSILGENYAFYHFVCHRYTGWFFLLVRPKND